MDFLNKSFAQITELFRSMTPAARITAGLLLAVVTVSAGYLFTHQVTGGDAYLLDGQHFSTSELETMQAAFGKAGLGTFEVDAGRLRVPRGLKAKYMAALADAGAMPAHFGSHLDAAMSKPSPFTSKTQQEAMLKNALQKELASIIGQMTGVENAAVFYDVQKKGGFRLENTLTASVSVKPVGASILPTAQVPKIRALVAGAIGASPSQVTVVDLNGRTYKAGGKDDLSGIFDDPYAQRVKYWCDEFESRIYRALEYVPGVVVTANVELDPHTKLQTEKTQVDPKPVTVRQQEETETNQADTAPPAGQPGLQAQRPNAPATLPATARGNHTEKERSSVKTENDFSREHTNTETAPLTPKKVTVTVGIPSGYFEEVYRKANPSPPGQQPQPIDAKKLAQIQKDETDKIQAHVANLIPHTDLTADQRPLVTVTPFAQLPAAAIPTPGIGEIAFDWLTTNWSAAGMTGLALVSLVMLRSMARSAPAQSGAADLPLLPSPLPAVTEAKKEAADAAQKGPGKLKRRLGSGQSLREELAEMVREDPDTAANILRTWIGSAG
ncbi:MAG TPA: flagellar M-ring protein FliF C-terminal domain-containing protein [Pirellulales bacterium]|jgi:flagellar M-ring protein FliF|nr:flagellar M-ring protein FliF C-terminal domain-containing protein [Pirellulales bacterium]